MSSTFEKSVKGATKQKLAPPKSKYVEHILQATRAGEAGVAEVFRVLSLRLRDSTWTVAFKALIVTHLMIREGEPDVTLRYLSTDARKMVSVSTYSDVQTQGRNIRHYGKYIVERASSFQKIKVDYVLNGTNRLKSLSVDKGLLRETEIIQDQIQALLKCDLLTEEMENEITLTAFRLLTMDLLVLYQVMNEGTICVLEHYFEMSRPDAERALSIYKAFTRLTEAVVKYLSVARDHQNATRLEIPKLKHAPTSLAASLEEYLNDRDFETNRRQYIVQQQAKNGVKSTSNTEVFSSDESNNMSRAKAVVPAAKQDPIASTSRSPNTQPSKGPAPDLIDFFDSIEQNQQPMAQDSAQFQQQAYVSNFSSFPQQTTQQIPTSQFGKAPTGGQFATQSTGNPFMQFQQQQQQPQYNGQSQMPPQFTADFDGYAPQVQQQTQQQFSSHTSSTFGGLDQFGQHPFSEQPIQQGQDQSTNPFRKSMGPTQVSSSFGASTQQHGSNPFARNNTLAEESPSQYGHPSYVPQPSFSQTPPPMQGRSGPIQPQQTGTNPFARHNSPALSQQQPFSAAPPGRANSTPIGGTNPFKQSAFMNQQTGLGWHTAPQNSMGGLETLDTVHVFPRPEAQQQFSQTFNQNQAPNQ